MHLLQLLSSLSAVVDQATVVAPTAILSINVHPVSAWCY